MDGAATAVKLFRSKRQEARWKLRAMMAAMKLRIATLPASHAWTGLDQDGQRHWIHTDPDPPEIGETMTIGDDRITCDGTAEEPRPFVYENAAGYIAEWQAGQ